MQTLQLRRILCAVDLTERSKSALATALAVARRFDARVWVLHVVDVNRRLGRLVPPWSPALLMSPSSDTLAGDLRLFTKEAGPDGMRATTAVRYGEPAREIVRYARSVRADLLVVGAPNVANIDGPQLSIAERSSAFVPAPTLFVPPGYVPNEPNPFEHVLCGIDLSHASGAAARTAAALAQAATGALTLVYVIPQEGGNGRRVPGSSAADAMEAQLASYVPAWAAREIGISYAVSEGPVSDELVRAAHGTGADVIVIGSSPHEALGSVARTIIRTSDVPVLVARHTTSVQPALASGYASETAFGQLVAS